MNAIELILRQLDDLWEHPWDSLAGALEGLTVAEADWQPAAYRELPSEAGWPPPGTIRWQIAHLTHCNRLYALRIELRGESQAEAVPEPKPRIPLESLESELEAMRTVQRALRATVAAVSAEELEQPLPDGLPLAEFLAIVVRHNTWHTGQIALLRRLYRAAHI